MAGLFPGPNKRDRIGKVVEVIPGSVSGDNVATLRCEIEGDEDRTYLVTLNAERIRALLAVAIR
jgi:hypothetical protein